MKTKQIISLALVLALLLTVITGCGTKDGSSTNNNEESTSVVYAEMKENEESISTTKPATENKTHSEYVKTYSVYAEQGAVVTWSDPKTGQFRYKDKCETCGQVASGEHNRCICPLSSGKTCRRYSGALAVEQRRSKSSLGKGCKDNRIT